MRVASLLLAASAFATTVVSTVPAHAVTKPALPSVGSAFPGFSLPDVTGKQVSLGDFKGKAILLSFWSCHTDTCFTSVRVFEELLKEYSALGLVAPTICSEVPPALEKDGYAGLLKQCGTGQIILIDEQKVLAQKLGIVEFPTTFLIDRNHAVWQVITGIRPLMTEEFRGLVKSLVTD